MNENTNAAADSKLAIEIRGMHKWYGQFHVLKDINLNVARGEKIVVCGPSGSGKSTMIRCINRLEEHQQGDIIIRVKHEARERQGSSTSVARSIARSGNFCRRAQCSAA